MERSVSLEYTGADRMADTPLTEDMSSDLDVFERYRQPPIPGLPKYAQLREALLAAIRAGHWKAGEKLPTELELAALTPFSLGTVQRALRELAETGILVRRQGYGSYVAETRKRMEDPWHARFVDDSGEGILPVYSTAIDRKRVVESGPWTQHLGTPRGGVLQIDRKIDINDEFTVFSRFFADPGLLKPLLNCPLDSLEGANFKILIARECYLPITRITHDLRSVTLDRTVARVVGVDPGSAGLFIQAVAHAGRDFCVYYQEFFVPPTERPLRFLEFSVGGEES